MKIFFSFFKKLGEALLPTQLSDARKWQKLYRLLNKKNSKIFHYINRIRYEVLMSRNCSSIPYQVKIGDNLYLPHGLSGIFISMKAVIGDNCTVFQQVTIGSNTLESSKNIGAPLIGNNVYIGAGAKIIGGIKIGNNVRIGANAIVYLDVPDNSTVVSGGGMRIISDCSEGKINSFHSILEDT